MHTERSSRNQATHFLDQNTPCLVRQNPTFLIQLPHCVWQNKTSPLRDRVNLKVSDQLFLFNVLRLAEMCCSQLAQVLNGGDGGRYWN